MRQTSIWISLAVVLCMPARACAADFYVWDGHQLTVQAGDPAQFQADWWVVWLFKKGAAQTPGKQWGEFLGHSAAEVMKELRHEQKAEQQLPKILGEWFRPGDTTYMNALGPVALPDRPRLSTKDQESWDEYGDALAQYKAMREVYENARALANDDAVAAETAKRSSLREFLQHLTEAREKVSTMAADLDKMNAPALSLISQALSRYDAQRDLSAAKGALSQLSRSAVDALQGLSRPPMSSPKQTFDFGDGPVEEAFREIDGHLIFDGKYFSGKYRTTPTYGVIDRGISGGTHWHELVKIGEEREPIMTAVHAEMDIADLEASPPQSQGDSWRVQIHCHRATRCIRSQQIADYESIFIGFTSRSNAEAFAKAYPRHEPAASSGKP